MMKYSWPILLALAPAIFATAVHPQPAKRTPAEMECRRQQREFTNSLGPVRQFPNAEMAYLASHKPGDKLDYGMCYNWRERVRRDIDLDQWQRTASAECQRYFRKQELQSAQRIQARGYKKKSLKEGIEAYNRACSHTMAGTL